MKAKPTSPLPLHPSDHGKYLTRVRCGALALALAVLAAGLGAPGCGKQPPPPPGADTKTEAPDVEVPGETESAADAEKELSHGTAAGKQAPADMPDKDDEIKDPNAPRDIDDLPAAKDK